MYGIRWRKLQLTHLVSGTMCLLFCDVYDCLALCQDQRLRSVSFEKGVDWITCKVRWAPTSGLGLYYSASGSRPKSSERILLTGGCRYACAEDQSDSMSVNRNAHTLLLLALERPDRSRRDVMFTASRAAQRAAWKITTLCLALSRETISNGRTPLPMCNVHDDMNDGHSAWYFK